MSVAATLSAVNRRLFEYRQIEPEGMDEITELFVNDEMLVQLIRSYTCLYDKKAPDYKDNQKKDKAWTAVAEVLGREVNEVIARWKCLRNQYCRYRRMRKEIKSETAEGSVKLWSFGESMSWLDPYVQPRRGNVPRALVHPILTPESDKGSPSSWDISTTFVTPVSPSDIMPELTDQSSVPSTSSTSVAGSPVLRPAEESTRCLRPKRKKVNGAENSPSLQDMSAVTHERRNLVVASDDEDILFGNLVTCTLKRMNRADKWKCKRGIMDLLAAYDRADVV